MRQIPPGARREWRLCKVPQGAAGNTLYQIVVQFPRTAKTRLLSRALCSNGTGEGEWVTFKQPLIWIKPVEALITFIRL
jgi:hypothetical protein